MNLLWSFLSLYLLLYYRVVAYAPDPRWGQATLVINDVFFVHGGKADQFNSYSYTSAPEVNDLMFLSLSDSFDASNPSWQLVSGAENTSTSQGPALSWHTLSATNVSEALLFGGLPGPNSQTVLFDRADSAALLHLSDVYQPIWEYPPTGWAGQPVRRIYHTAATSPSGTVYIIGGQMADGSGNTFSDNYAFDPKTSTFTGLASENGPPNIYGHAAIILSDGRLLVFGGVSQGSLVSFSTIWVLDTTKNPPTWSSTQVASGHLPTPRRAFAAVLLGENKILIHGGSDANLQVNFDDGWILDASSTPITWTLVEPLAQLGARRDHFALYFNGLTIFGFGYLNNGPASTELHIFDLSSNTFVPTYEPPPPSATIPHTIPGQTSTHGHHTGMSTGKPGSSNPTSVTHGGNPTATAGQGDDEGRGSSVAAIVLGTTFGFLALVVLGVGVFIYMRRQRRKGIPGSHEQFILIGGNDDGDNSLHTSHSIPAATMRDAGGTIGGKQWGAALLGTAFGIAGSLSAITKTRNARTINERRDMLADEDANDFGEWYHSRKREDSVGSSWTLGSFIGNRFGSRRSRGSREPSIFSYNTRTSHRQERTDPFSDGTSLMHDEELSMPEGPAIKPESRTRNEASQSSTKDGYTYIDPFGDPLQEENKDDHSEYDPTSLVSVSNLPRGLPTIRTILPVSFGGHTLSPLSEQTSKSSLPFNEQGTVTSAYTEIDNPFNPTISDPSSRTSVDTPRSPPIPSSIIAGSAPASNIRRSDSWWSRIYRSSFLDRRTSSTSRQPNPIEIRDPNPPPVVMSALGAIRETVDSKASEEVSIDRQSTSDDLPKGKTKVYETEHGKSMTSLRTADTERIERIGQTMNVAQRMRASGSTSSGLSTDTRRTEEVSPHAEQHETVLCSSPTELATEEGSFIQRTSSSRHNPITDRAKPPASLPPVSLYNSMPFGASSTTSPSHEQPTSPGTSVAARVQMYERRMSRDQEQPPPTNTKRLEERPAKRGRASIDYGLVPRPSLFVANPDHRASYSSD